MREIRFRGERLIDANTAEDLTDISADTWRKWGREGRLPVMKIGRLVRFKWSDFKQFWSNLQASRKAKQASGTQLELNFDASEY
jgi:excisionase family DNA binding protein